MLPNLRALRLGCALLPVPLFTGAGSVGVSGDIGPWCRVSGARFYWTYDICTADNSGFMKYKKPPGTEAAYLTR